MYLGKTVKQDGELLPEINKRIALGWAAFGKVENIMKSRKSSMKIKRRLLNECILPVMTYGSETWTLSKPIIEKLSVAQHKMERIMLGITLRDKKRNSWIRQQMGPTNIPKYVKKSKHRWAGHISRFTDNR